MTSCVTKQLTLLPFVCAQHAATEGPCLVLFKNMHLTPEQLDAWLLACFVGRVCMRVFWLDRSTPAAGSW
jgi:hypothetical protein